MSGRQTTLEIPGQRQHRVPVGLGLTRAEFVLGLSPFSMWAVQDTMSCPTCLSTLVILNLALLTVCGSLQIVKRNSGWHEKSP